MLLEPAKKKLNLPASFVDIRDLLSRGRKKARYDADFMTVTILKPNNPMLLFRATRICSE